MKHAVVCALIFRGKETEEGVQCRVLTGVFDYDTFEFKHSEQRNLVIPKGDDELYKLRDQTEDEVLRIVERFKPEKISKYIDVIGGPEPPKMIAEMAI